MHVIRANTLRIHTRKEYIDVELRQTHEFRQLLQSTIYFPNDYTLNLAKELRLLSIPGAMLSGEEVLQFRKLTENIQKIFRWFDPERRATYNALAKVIEHVHYEKGNHCDD